MLEKNGDGRASAVAKQPPAALDLGSLAANASMAD